MDLLLKNLRDIGVRNCDTSVGVAAAEEIERLRAALSKLEAACDRRAACLTHEMYLAGISVPGMREAAIELDDARRNARQVLTPNAQLTGAARAED